MDAKIITDQKALAIALAEAIAQFDITITSFSMQKH